MSPVAWRAGQSACAQVLVRTQLCSTTNALCSAAFHFMWCQLVLRVSAPFLYSSASARPSAHPTTQMTAACVTLSVPVFSCFVFTFLFRVSSVFFGAVLRCVSRVPCTTPWWNAACVLRVGVFAETCVSSEALVALHASLTCACISLCSALIAAAAPCFASTPVLPQIARAWSFPISASVCCHATKARAFTLLRCSKSYVTRVKLPHTAPPVSPSNSVFGPEPLMVKSPLHVTPSD
ncbi:hypothetical protein TRVL_01843 [Trypanosoma vivax]|nr:hypothetical protein TRVL_01843 [Trypanosoma vivax]